MNDRNSPILFKNKEIDIIAILLTLWNGRRLIIRSILISFVFAIIIIFTTPKKYTTESTMVVESGTGVGSISNLLQQFGGMAGINFNAAKENDALVPLLYPDIVKSTPFLLELLEQKVQYKNSDSLLCLSDYIIKMERPSLVSLGIKYTLGIPGLILDLFQKEKPELAALAKDTVEPIVLTKLQVNQIRRLVKIIQIDQDKESEIIHISIETQDPYISASLTKAVINLLSLYIIDYRVQKAKVDYQFILDRVNEAEKKFRTAQNNLAKFKEQNRNIVLASTEFLEQNLQSEYNLTFTIYNTLFQQLEQSRMKVQEKTPVFKIMEPPIVPNSNSKPQKSVIIFMFFILGLLAGSGIILGKSVFNEYRLKNMSKSI